MAGRGYLISRLAKAKVKQHVDEESTKSQHESSNGFITKTPAPDPVICNGTIVGSNPTVPRGRRAIFENMAKRMESNQNLTSTFLSLQIKNSDENDLIDKILPVSPLNTNDKVLMLSKPTEYQEKLITTLQQPTISIDETLKVEKPPVTCSVPIKSENNNYRMTQLASNYIPIVFEQNIGIYEYNVTFNPPIDSKQARFYLLNGQRETFPIKTFDGTLLYIPTKLPQDITTLMGKLKDESEVKMTIKFLKKKNVTDSIQFYNILLRSILKNVGLIEFGRNHFDSEKKIIIHDYNIEVWPGYVAVVEEFENGINLCCDISHRILRSQTTLKVMEDIITISKKKGTNFKEDIMSKLCGSTVITRYNNKTYRIDDIDFSITPLSTFNHNGTDTSFVDYYKNMYDIIIQHHNQPMIISKAKKNIIGTTKDTDIICLVPELSYLTGLTEEMRTNYKLMKTISTYIQITPELRQRGLIDLVNRINNHDIAKQKLINWGLTLNPNPMEVNGPVYKQETIVLGNQIKKQVGTNMDWGSDVIRNQMFTTIHLLNWFVLCIPKEQSITKSFCNQLTICGKYMGMDISSPQIVLVPGTNPEAFVGTLNNIIMRNSDLQLIVIIMPNQREDRYNAIKRICCVENGIPSQVIISRTLSKPDRLRSIAQKIVLQINCKIGGACWAIDIPLKNTMIIGIDTYHEKNKQLSSVVGFVASMDKAYTQWYSVAGIQKSSQEEIMSTIQMAFHTVLNQFKLKNGLLPEKIIIYRDGVSFGDFTIVEEIELSNLQESFKKYSINYNPMVTFIIVHKRINTRIFQFIDNKYSNPMPGTVVDNSITTRNYFDFFLVSQHVRQGTVNPTHYIVLKNGCNLSMENIQRLSYKLCHLYYNWCGTIKVPAPIQYAHKLAYLIGQNIRQLPNEKLTNSLFFL